MTVILEPGFETVTNWTYAENDPNGHFSGLQDTTWKKEGSNSYKLLISGTGTINESDYLEINQTINIPSGGFGIYFDVYGFGYDTIILIDSTVVFYQNIFGESLNNFVDLSSYAGNGKVLRLRHGTNHTSGYSGSDIYIKFDNIRETTNIYNIYVDINKADDTGAGTSWATSKKTMNAGYTILAPTGTMHVASGDYSAQTTIAYNKSWKLSCEDPNSTGTKSVKIPRNT